MGETAEIIAILALGLIAGVASGMFGIGGGVIIVPILITFFSFTQLEANGTSLAARLVPVGIFGALAYWRAGKIKIVDSAAIAVGLAIGAWFGARIAQDLPQDTLKQIYGVFLLYVSWRFIEPQKLWANWQNNNAPADNSSSVGDEKGRKDASLGVLLPLGLVAGVASGMFGIGGGVVIVPALIGILKFEQRQATGTSLTALQFPVAIPAVIEYYRNDNLNASVAVIIGIGILLGAFFGAKIALGLSGKSIKRAYGVFLLIVGLRFLFG